MARFGFVGGTYQSDSVNADAQRCWNWYPEVSESGAGVSIAMLYPSPGLKRFAELSGTHVRGMYEFNGRLFVYTDLFYEVFPDGTFSQGQNFVPDDGMPVSMEANSAQQLLICGGGQVYMFSLAGGSGGSGQPPPSAPTNPIIAIQYWPAFPQTIPPRAAFIEIWSSTPFPTPMYALNTTLYLGGLTAYPALNGQAVSFRGGSNTSSDPGPSTYAISVSVPANFTGTPGALLAETGTVSSVPGGAVTANVLPPGTIERVAYLDGYFLALAANSATVYYSGLNNGGVWNALSQATVSEFPENILSMIINFRELWLFSDKRAIVYYDAGDPLTPIQPIPGAYIEHGINAPWSVTRLDNSLFWLGSDERGRNVAWRSQGYTPVRISTHGVESIWKTYPTLSDAIGYATSKCGHGWWHLYFPSVDHSWRYDTTTNMWHEVAVFHPSDGSIGAHRSRTHAYAFEKNLVGDNRTGTIYELTGVPYDDLPDLPLNPIRRARRAPHVIAEHEWMFHHKMRVLLEAGLGPIPPLAGQADGVVQLAFLDQNGVYWMANIMDNGIWATESYATTEQLVVPLSNLRFVDLAYWPYQTVVYAMGAPDLGGLTGYFQNVPPTLTLLAPPDSLSGFITSLPLQTAQTGLQTRLSVLAGQLQIDPPQLAPREPEMMLRWSDDGGHTWSNEYLCGAGFAGEFRRRVEWRRLGRSRDRIYEVSTTDSIPWRIVDAYLDAAPGYDMPTERYATQVRKMA